jgi:S-(hydroxymethyl)glutathione dehydrogenase/alcohol dehydrogenase
LKAAVAYRPGTKAVVEDVELPKLGARDVLVRLVASGVCHSDWHILKGDWGSDLFPLVLGHEGAGIVEAVGEDVTHTKPGDHVVLSFRTSCGICEMCQRGWPVLCNHSPTVAGQAMAGETAVGVTAGLGTFAEYALVNAVAVVPIDPDIPLHQASLVGCGVTTGVGAVINTAKVEAGSTVAVFGCGGVGLNCIQGAVIAGAEQIIAVDLLDNKLEMGRQFGATHTLNAKSCDPVEAIRELTAGQGVHYAFEAIGVAEAPFVQSILCTRKRGVTVWVGHAPLDTPVTIDARTLLYEKSVIGSFYGSARPHVEFPKLLAMYKSGRLKLDELITRRFPLKDVNEAFAALSRGEVARSVLDLAN